MERVPHQLRSQHISKDSVRPLFTNSLHKSWHCATWMMWMVQVLKNGYSRHSPNGNCTCRVNPMTKFSQKPGFFPSAMILFIIILGFPLKLLKSDTKSRWFSRPGYASPGTSPTKASAHSRPLRIICGSGSKLGHFLGPWQSYCTYYLTINFWWLTWLILANIGYSHYYYSHLTIHSHILKIYKTMSNLVKNVLQRSRFLNFVWKYFGSII